MKMLRLHYRLGVLIAGQGEYQMAADSLEKHSSILAFIFRPATTTSVLCSPDLAA